MLKKCFSCVLVILLALSILPLSAFAETTSQKSGATGDCVWKLDGTVLTISGNGKMKSNYYESNYGVSPWGRDLTEVRIEEGVTYISGCAFYGCEKLTSVTIPDGVTGIGSEAFGNCKSLSRVRIPDSVSELGGAAFRGCVSLTEFFLPNTVEKINTSTFQKCENLTKLVIEDGSEISVIDEYAFKGCTNLKYINIPKTLRSIGTSAFEGCASLELMLLPEGIRTIGNCAFYNCSSLADVSIPDSIMNVGEKAFDRTAIYLNRENWDDGCLYISNCLIRGSGSIRARTKCIAAFAFYRTSIDEVVDLPESIENISFSAFSGCSQIVRINIPQSVKYIGDNAFYGCDGLREVHIKSLEKWCDISFLDYDANPLQFAHNLYLNDNLITDLVIPESVSEISAYAFVGGTCFQKVVFHDGVTSIGYGAFRGCSGLVDLEIPNTMTTIASYTYFGCTGIKNLVIPEGVETIYYSAFENCTGLTSVSIPSSVKTILNRAFKGCTGLTELTIPNSVTAIRNEAFSKCMSLKSIIIPGGVSELAAGAFFDCVLLTDVIIENGVQMISDSAFSGCESLVSIIIPDSVVYLGEKIFFGCNALTTLTISDSVTKTKNSPFLGCSIKNLKIAEGSKTITKDMVACENTLENVEIPSTVTDIGNSAFADCIALSSITIPDTVTNISSSAFSGCNRSKLTIYTGSVHTAAYTYAKKNDYRCAVKMDGATNVYFMTNNSVLEIIGSGKMPNYNLFTSTPWYAETDNITRIVIDGRITDVGTYSFYGFDNLKAVVTENPDLVFHQYALNTANTALTVYSYAGGTLEQYCNDNGVRFVAPLDTPTLLGVTENTITVKAESGLEYSLDKESWRTDGVFTGLSPVTEYTVYVRRKKGYTPIEGTPLKVKTTKRVIAAPAVPAIQAYDTTTVTLKPMTGYEYSKDGITWQQSNVFTGIVSDRIYGFRQRLAETDTDFASASSRPLYYAMPSKPEILSVGATTLTVKAVEGFEYSLDKITWQKDPYFSALIYGMEYTVYQRIAEVDNAYTYAVISAGTAMRINGIDKKTPATPSAPVAESKTSDTVTLKKTAGYEYRMDSGAWQKSPVFTGLAPNSTHRFYQRVAETDTTYASASSEGTCVALCTVGDLDGDEEITDWDGVLLARYLAGWNVDISNVDALDIDGDGEITDWDGVLLDRYLAGWDIKIS